MGEDMSIIGHHARWGTRATVVWEMSPDVARSQAELIRNEFSPKDGAQQDAKDLEWWADEVEGKHDGDE